MWGVAAEDSEPRWEPGETAVEVLRHEAMAQGFQAVFQPLAGGILAAKGLPVTRGEPVAAIMSAGMLVLQ